MPLSPLFGRRIHIAGSIDQSPAVASTEAVAQARTFVEQLTLALLRAGATFVVPVDDEKVRAEDDQPICFDWLIQKTIVQNLVQRPRETVTWQRSPVIVAVQHYKTEGQIPSAYADQWDTLRASDQVYVENANRWDMNSKRLEMQAAHGDILITLGGGEGVLFLANLYHDAGKPVIPLNCPVVSDQTGSRRLFSVALTRPSSAQFFRMEDGTPAHSWINRINFVSRHDCAHRVQEVMRLLEALERPTVFGVRLLNPNHKKYGNVDTYFQGVVLPVVESFGYKLVIVDGKISSEESLINHEIFTKLHRSNIVIADMTGERPNNYIEVGYALGRGHRVMITAEKGTHNPFDIQPVPTLFWSPSAALAERQAELRAHWTANMARRRLVEPDLLVP